MENYPPQSLLLPKILRWMPKQASRIMEQNMLKSRILQSNLGLQKADQITLFCCPTVAQSCLHSQHQPKPGNVKSQWWAGPWAG